MMGETNIAMREFREAKLWPDAEREVEQVVPSLKSKKRAKR